MKEATLGLNLIKIIQAKKKRYHGITSLLMFSIVETRPDITFSIVVTACFIKTSITFTPKPFK